MFSGISFLLEEDTCWIFMGHLEINDVMKCHMKNKKILMFQKSFKMSRINQPEYLR